MTHFLSLPKPDSDYPDTPQSVFDAWSEFSVAARNAGVGYSINTRRSGYSIEVHREDWEPGEEFCCRLALSYRGNTGATQRWSITRMFRIAAAHLREENHTPGGNLEDKIPQSWNEE